MLLPLLPLLLFVSSVLACHPECILIADNATVAFASCMPYCQKPVCAVQCVETNYTLIGCETPQCRVRCPADMCESEACPACETVCDPLVCQPFGGTSCEIVCEQTACTWLCQERANYVCEHPACEFTLPSVASALGSIASTLLLLWFFV